MIISINQPAYLPWLGYFDRIIKSDLHIILDNVQFEKNSMTNRNKARTINGWTWLSIPLFTKGLFGNLVLKNVEIDNSQNWRKKHYGTLLSSYGKAAYFKEYRSWFSEFYDREWKIMGPLLEDSTNFLLQSLGINTPMRKASEIKVGKKVIISLIYARRLMLQSICPALLDVTTWNWRISSPRASKCVSTTMNTRRTRSFTVSSCRI